MRIEGGTWFFCSDADFAGHCQTFGPGEYAHLPWTQDRVASGYYVPERHSEGVRVGDAKIGITTTEHHKLPAWVGGVLVAGGIVMMVAGGRGRN